MTDQLDRLKAALADRYELERQLGVGGMATVYLAEDLKHHRKVAVKVLRPELAAVLGAERFVQEITTTANLQHPHILPLFDSGEADGFLYYVMPFIEGETLRDKLNRETQLGIEEAVKITTEVADALDYAHRHNVIHRDIKPENILLHDGRPMVADFGIALAVSAAAGGRMTETGLSLGTPHYMSPEQATAEKDITHRSDIYSLGSVLYEMLSGEPPHTGASAQAIVMKIVTEDVQPVTQLRKSVPPHVAAATAKSLEKLAADRFATAAEFSEALTNARLAPVVTTVPRNETQPQISAAVAWHAFGKWVVVAALVLVGVTAALVRGLKPAEEQDVTSFTVPVAGGHEMLLGGEVTNLALSPDGRTLVYGAQGMLHVRKLARVETSPLAGTEGAVAPFFSPDGQQIGFIKGGLSGALMRVPVDGGAVTEISNATIGGPYGASWGADGTIVYIGGDRGLWRVAITEGVPQAVTTVLDTASETIHTWPQLLPGGRLILFTAMGPSALWEDAKIVVKDLETGERKTVIERATYGRYVPTGHILYAEATGTILAVPFDLDRREKTGAPFPVESGVRVAGWGGAASLAVSDGGTVAFVRGSTWNNHLLWWVDRQGRHLELGSPLTGGFLDLSPDGRRAAIMVVQPKNTDIHLVDAVTKDTKRFTFDAARNETPVWSPDGRRIAYSTAWGGQSTRIYMKEVDSAAEPVSILTRDRHVHLTSWSPDGQWLAFHELHPENQWDIYVVQIDSVQNLIPVAVTEANEDQAQFSPDGGWLAFQSDGEVNVVSFPPTARMDQVSTDGGLGPRWSAEGDELFFWKGDTLTATRVSTRDLFRWETTRPVFTLADREVYDNDVVYDVTADGQRFLLEVKNRDAPAAEISVVLNFFEELKAKVGN